MKKLLLFLLLVPFLATAQQTFFNGAPSGSTPATIGFRVGGTPTDSLSRKLYAFWPGGYSWLYTGTQINNLFQTSIYINAGQYLVGDSTTDNTTAMRAMFAMASANGATVYFPKGNYLISDTVNVPKSCKILGNGGMAPYTGTTGSSPMGSYQGGNSVIIQTASNKSALVINADGADIQGITVKCTATTPTAGAGIKVIKGNSFRINNTFIGGFYSNLSILSGVDMVISGNQFVNPVLYNLFISGVIGDEGCNTITANMFNSSKYATAIQLHADVPAGIRIINNEFHIGTGQPGPNYALGVIDINSIASTSEPFIIGNGIEAYTGFGVRVRVASSAITLGKIIIQANQFESFTSNGVHDIDIQSPVAGNISGVSITNNNVGQNGIWASIYVSNVRGVTVAGNNIAGNDLSYQARSDSLVNCTDVRYKISSDLYANNIYQNGNQVANDNAVVHNQNSAAESASYWINGSSIFTPTIGGSSGTNTPPFIYTPTINQSGTAQYNIFRISPYIQSFGSSNDDVNYLLDVGYRSAAYPSGTHTSVFTFGKGGGFSAAKFIQTGSSAMNSSTITTPRFLTTGTSAQGVGTVENSGMLMDLKAASMGTNLYSTTTTTLTNAQAFYLGVPTIQIGATPGVVTVTDASSMSLDGPPVAANSNTVLTNPWTFHVKTGNSYFGGKVNSTDAQNVIAPNYSLTSTSPGLDSIHQGYTYGAISGAHYHFLSNTTAIYKCDSTWRKIDSIKIASLGISNINHFGDLKFDNNKLYIPAEKFTSGTSYSDQKLLVFDAASSGLPLLNNYDISAQAAEVSGATVNVDTVIVESYYTGNKLYKYNKNTGAYISTLTLDKTLHGTQGIDVYNGKYYYFGAFGLYTSSLTGTNFALIHPSGTTAFQTAASPEGGDIVAGQLRWLIDNTANGGTSNVYSFDVSGTSAIVKNGADGDINNEAYTRVGGTNPNTIPGFAQQSIYSRNPTKIRLEDFSGQTGTINSDVNTVSYAKNAYYDVDLGWQPYDVTKKSFAMLQSLSQAEFRVSVAGSTINWLKPLMYDENGIFPGTTATFDIGRSGSLYRNLLISGTATLPTISNTTLGTTNIQATGLGYNSGVWLIGRTTSTPINASAPFSAGATPKSEIISASAASASYDEVGLNVWHNGTATGAGTRAESIRIGLSDQSSLSESNKSFYWRLESTNSFAGSPDLYGVIGGVKQYKFGYGGTFSITSMTTAGIVTNNTSGDLISTTTLPSSTTATTQSVGDNSTKPATTAFVQTAKRLVSYTVATLPATPTTGDQAAVTDALTPTYLGVLVGGGSTYTPVVYNGTAWVSH